MRWLIWLSHLQLQDNNVFLPAALKFMNKQVLSCTGTSNSLVEQWIYGLTLLHSFIKGTNMNGVSDKDNMIAIAIHIPREFIEER